jgi:hypothetical protein
MELVVRSGFGSTSILTQAQVGFSPRRLMDLLERKRVVVSPSRFEGPRRAHDHRGLEALNPRLTRLVLRCAVAKWAPPAGGAQLLE